ncbi:Vps51/Vps67-domain-containing protein [Trametes punicea]|nr:Vps51/Vps67-domain-containing protein [Trametes punicea]
MSLNPPSTPPRTPYSPNTPGTPHAPYTPHSAPGTPPRSGTRTPAASIPRPPSSPLRRPASPSSLRSASGAGPSSSSTPRRTSGPMASASASSVALEGRAGPGVERQKTRARELLRKHYGLGLGPPPPLGGAKSSQDPMDFDSPAFDAKAYYEQLITTSSLPTLLKTENDLLTEIRQLDSERQSLVYNHHHELIAASDTIAAMKSRAENLDADLDLLRAAFSEISRLSAEIAVEHASSTERRAEARPSVMSSQ